MVARTVKFMGSAYSTGTTATVQIEYNNAVVYSGTLPANTQDPLPVNQPDPNPDWEQELFSFVTDTDITGEIPMRISVTNGTVYFAHLWMNYCGNVKTEQDPNDPTKYSKVPVPPVDFWGDPNTNTEASDGISNDMKNGVAWDWRVNVGDQLGDWAYPVTESETFTFDFYVDPALIVLDPYTPP